ncbi:hypothetical protein [Devosia riboflavina]
MDWLLQKRTIFRRGRFVAAAVLVGPGSVIFLVFWAAFFSNGPRSGGGFLELITNAFLYALFGYAFGILPALAAALLLVWRRSASILEAVIITTATTASLSFLTQPGREQISPLSIAVETGRLGALVLPGMICAGLVAHWWGAFRDHHAD